MNYVHVALEQFSALQQKMEMSKYQLRIPKQEQHSPLPQHNQTQTIEHQQLLTSPGERSKLTHTCPQMPQTLAADQT